MVSCGCVLAFVLFSSDGKVLGREEGGDGELPICELKGAGVAGGPAKTAAAAGPELCIQLPLHPAAPAAPLRTPMPSAALSNPPCPAGPPPHPSPTAAVKYCLRKMRAQAAAEEKKKQRQAKLDGGAGSGKAAGSAGAADEAGEEAGPEAKAAGGKGKRGRSRTASAEAEAEGAAAKKVKA